MPGSSWRGCLAAAAGVGLLGPRPSGGQITWGPSPLNVQDTDDLANQRRLYELLQRAYTTGYSADTPRHTLMQATRAEIAEFRQRVPSQPSLALAVAMAKYHFEWYAADGAEMDVAAVEDAADLMYAGIRFSGCDRADLSAEAFFQRLCSARWPYAVMLYSELGREYAMRYLTEQAADMLEKAVAAFEEMKRLPYFAAFAHWQGPYDINFNEEWYPGALPRGPVWDKAVVPLAAFLEANSATFTEEMASLVDRGLFDRLHFESIRTEGHSAAPEGAWRSVELAHAASGEAAWTGAACKEAPRTCALLSSREELRGCAHWAASFVRLGAGGRVKPHYGAAPKLQAHLAIRADAGARMSAGNQTLAWRTGEAIVFDDTHIRQDWHVGRKGDLFVLQVTLCHPCEESQRERYAGAVSCPTPAAAAARTGAPPPPALVAATPEPPEVLRSLPFAAAAYWAASLPELALCSNGISEQCPPDSQHGGPNPLSAVVTWNYALNNLRAALLHANVQVDPAVLATVLQVQAAIQGFIKVPALQQFLPIVSTAAQIFEAVGQWLRQQPPAQVRIVAPPSAVALRLPSNGRTPAGEVAFTLANGVRMPAVGFGTWKLEGEQCREAVLAALRAGVRHIDTAEAYSNEEDIGRALRESGVPREELFIATKATSVPLGMADPQYLEAVFVAQLNALQTEYVDVYMLHAAGVRGEKLRAVWQGMERIHDLGRARALGVSNFGVEELEELWSFARVKPVYLQNIFKAYKPGEQLPGSGPLGPVQWARSRGVAVVGYSIINAWPHLLPPLKDPHVLAIARSHGKTASQVLHRWALQQGVAVIPKASSPERIRENIALFDFELQPSEMAVLDGLATLSESTHDEVRPAWNTDTFGLQQTSVSGLQGAAA